MKKDLLRAKESEYTTTMYSHECPYCNDPCDDYPDSAVGTTLECMCGHSYEVVK